MLCAVVLSLAYPVREYIAQRRQIDQLVAQQAEIARQISRLEQEQRRLHNPAYIEQLARDRLHMCLPNQMCYVIIKPTARRPAGSASQQAAEPWYAKLWSSVRLADGQRSADRHANDRRAAG
jgi:cell division protein FtsL